MRIGHVVLLCGIVSVAPRQVESQARIDPRSAARGGVRRCDSSRAMRVLFLGREATPANNVPAQVEAIASALGGPCMTTDLIAIGPAAQGPSTAERVARRVSEGRWTHVVLLPIGPATEDIARAIDRRMPATTEMCKLSVRGAPFQARDVYEAIAETPAAIRPVDAKASTGMIWRMAPDSARRPAR